MVKDHSALAQAPPPLSSMEIRDPERELKPGDSQATQLRDIRLRPPLLASLSLLWRMICRVQARGGRNLAW